MGDKREEKIWAREEGDKGEKRVKEDQSVVGGEEAGDGKGKESNFGWAAADLSWPAIRRTSRP